MSRQANENDIEALAAEFLPAARVIERREPPAGNRLVLYLLLAMLGSAVLWASLSSLDQVVITRGRLVTPGANLVVQPLDPGILKSIEVRVGQTVRPGQVLATLDATFASADEAALSSRAATLHLQTRRLESELANTTDEAAGSAAGQAGLQASLLAERRATFSARVRQYDEAVARLRATLTTNRQVRAAQADQLDSLVELEKMYAELLDLQLVSRAEYLAVRERRLGVEKDLTHLVNREPEILREIETAQAEREAFVKSWRQDAWEKLAATAQQHGEVAEQLTKARLRSRLVNLTAPAAGIVLEIGKKSVGSVVKEAEPLFVLVPIDGPLEAEVEVAPADAGEVRAGLPVRIKLDSYPFQKHGTLRGRVLRISPDAFSRPAGPTGEAFYYLARIQLDDFTLTATPQPTRLLPGMTMAGEIVTGRRTVLSYFLYPLIRIWDESLRER